MIIVNNEDRIVKSGVVPVPLSDHYLVFCIIKVGIRNKSKPKLIEYRSYKNFNANDFNNDLRNVPWHVIESESDVDEALSTWTNLFSAVADDHAPIRK